MTNNVATQMTNLVNNQSLIPSTNVIQLTLTVKMTTAQVVETSAIVNKLTKVLFRTMFTWTIILNPLMNSGTVAWDKENIGQ